MSVAYLCPPPFDAPRHGILLKPHSSYNSMTSSSSSSHPPSPRSSSSDSSQTHSKRTHRPTQSNRRIRFAPLPDPRRDSDPSNEQLPLIILDEDEKRINDEPCSMDDTAVITYPDPSPVQQQTSLPKPSSSWTSTKKLLRPFRKSKKHASEGSGITLFRSESRDSTNSMPHSTSPNFGSPLKRSTSAGSSAGRSYSVFGHPLTTVASESSALGNPRTTRMLNGRVYGGSRSRSTPADRLPDPEFVEWGYGGMGSQGSSKTVGSSAYSKVQSSATNAVAGSAAELDDGSGMGWVRRRREARERERKEREENGTLEPTTADPPSSTDQLKHLTIDLNATPTASRTHTPPPHAEMAKDQESHAPSTPTLPSHSTPTLPSPSAEDDGHIYRAINIPPTRTASHRMPPSRQNTDPRSGAATPTLGMPRRSTESIHTLTGSTSPPPPSASVGRRQPDKESSLGEEDEEDEEESASTDRSDYEQSEEDDLSEEEKRRMTTRCAGVEKISRHKD